MHSIYTSKFIRTILFTVFLGFACVHGSASGTTAASFLKLTAGAKSEGMGGNALGLMSGAEALFQNPSALGSANEAEALFSHDEMYLGLRREYASFIMTSFNLGTFGIQWNALTSGVLVGARDIDENAVSPSATDMGMGVAWGRSFLGQRLLVGAHGQYIQSRLDATTARGMSADVGVAFNFPANIRVTAVARNMSPGLSFLGTKEAVPFGSAMDVAWCPTSRRVGLSVGFKEFSGSALRVTTGLEAVVHPALILRAGYEHAMQDDGDASTLKGLSVGAGMGTGGFSVDYAFGRRSGFLGDVHSMSASFRFGKLIPPTDRDFLRRATLQFGEEKYEACIKSAQQALKLNPSLWQAHQLIEEANQRLKVREKSVVALFYTGNTQGVFVPSSDRALGGLSRRSGLLTALRADYPFSFTVDGGNFLSSASEPLKWEPALKILRYLKYDAVNLGNQEFSMPLDSIFQFFESSGQVALSSNVRLVYPSKALIDYKDFVVGDRFRVTVLGAVAPVKQPHKLAIAEAVIPSIRPLVAATRDSSDILVLLYSGDLKECAAIAKEIPGIDVVVSSASHKVTYEAEREGRTLIVSAGENGEYLGFLSLHFNKNKKLVSFNNRCIPLDGQVPEDEALSRKLKSMLKEGDGDNDSPLLPSPYYLPCVSSFDMTAWHGRIKTDREIDSLSHLELMVKGVDSSALDSIARSMHEAESLRVAKALQAGGFWGVSDATDSSDQIYLQHVPTGKFRRITWNRRINRDPQLNLQGSAVLFFSDTARGHRRESELRVHLIREKLTYTIVPEVGNVVTDANFSPDGGAVYTIERDKNGKQDIFLRGISRKARYNVSRTPTANEYEVAASPDGRNLAMTSDREPGRPIYLSDPTGLHPIRLTFDEGVYFNLHFSPSGRLLAFARKDFESDERASLFLMELGRNRVDTLVQNQRIGSVLFRGDDELYVVQGLQYTDINVYDLPTGRVRRLTQRKSDHVFSEQNPVLFDFGDTVKVFFELQGPSGTEVYKTDDKTGLMLKADRPDVYRLR